jgi:hypothetical protein
MPWCLIWHSNGTPKRYCPIQYRQVEQGDAGQTFFRGGGINWLSFGIGKSPVFCNGSKLNSFVHSLGWSGFRIEAFNKPSDNERV